MNSVINEIVNADDPFELSRFLSTQEGVFDTALAELKAGRKQTHWVWFVFPQTIGLGTSSMARRYAIHSKEEAEAYLHHPILGSRLTECAKTLLSVQGKSAREIMGSPDDVKLRSSMTLFAVVSDRGSTFECVLEKYFTGQMDERTLAILENRNG